MGNIIKGQTHKNPSIQTALFNSHGSTSHSESQWRVVCKKFILDESLEAICTSRSFCPTKWIFHYIHHIGLCCLLVKQREAEQCSLELDSQPWDAFLKPYLKIFFIKREEELHSYIALANGITCKQKFHFALHSSFLSHMLFESQEPKMHPTEWISGTSLWEVEVKKVTVFNW